jgi:hypothetical protein
MRRHSIPALAGVAGALALAGLAALGAGCHSEPYRDDYRALSAHPDDPDFDAPEAYRRDVAGRAIDRDGVEDGHLEDARGRRDLGVGVDRNGRPVESDVGGDVFYPDPTDASMKTK